MFIHWCQDLLHAFFDFIWFVIELVATWGFVNKLTLREYMCKRFTTALQGPFIQNTAVIALV